MVTPSVRFWVFGRRRPSWDKSGPRACKTCKICLPEACPLVAGAKSADSAAEWGFWIGAGLPRCAQTARALFATVDSPEKTPVQDGCRP